MSGSTIKPYWYSRLIGIALLSAYAGNTTGTDFNAEYTADLLRNTSGGIETGTRYVDKLDLAFGIDMSKRPGIAAGSLFARMLYTNATTFSDELVGDLQIVSNIDASEAWRVFELWYEYTRASWSVKAGLYDLNSEFDTNETGALFLNSSHGIGADLGQTGRNGPGIYPVSSAAVRARFDSESLAVRAVVMDAVPGNPDDPGSNRIELDDDDGALVVAELDLPLSESARLWSGYWRYTGDFDRAFDAGSDRGNEGWYVGLETDFPIGARRAGFFIRVGHADERFNAFDGYAGIGAVIHGPFAARPDDRLGIAMASGRTGMPYREYLDSLGQSAEPHETAWELTYRAQVTEHLVIQPDIQYVQNPAASGAIDNAWVVGIRFQWSGSSTRDY